MMLVALNDHFRVNTGFLEKKKVWLKTVSMILDISIDLSSSLAQFLAWNLLYRIQTPQLPNCPRKVLRNRPCYMLLVLLDWPHFSGESWIIKKGMHKNPNYGPKRTAVQEPAGWTAVSLYRNNKSMYQLTSSMPQPLSYSFYLFHFPL